MSFRDLLSAVAWRMIVLAALCPPAHAAGEDDRSTGKWLVDLGRDYAASDEATGTDADARIVLSFMQAAARIEPQLAEPYLWQYDMLRALQRFDEARDALRAYVDRAPDNVSAHLLWIELAIDQFQTAEKRADFCRRQLDRADLPAEIVSDLHRRLAEFAYNRGQMRLGEQHVRQALEAFSLNLAAKRLRNEYRTVPAGPADRAAVLLARIAANPADPASAWQLARLLDAAGLHTDARFWYEHGERLFELAGTQPPAEFLLDRAGNYADLGQQDQALALARKAFATGRQQPDAVRKQAEQWLADRRRPASQPTTQQAVRALLEQFDRTVLDFPFHPGRYVRLVARLDSSQLRFAQPWRCTFVLENTGPFAISLGEGAMVPPTAIVSIITVGDRRRDFLHCMPAGLNRRPVLAPGESIRLEQTLDFGPVAEAMFCTPQAVQRIVISILLAPVQDEKGQWRSQLPGIKPTILRAERKALRLDDAKLAALFAQAASDQKPARLRAVVLLAALLAEAERLKDGRLSYPARAVDTQRIRAALIERLADASPMVRARLLDVLRFVRPDNRLVAALAPRLSDEHWLVRLMAVRLLGHHQRAGFATVAARIAETDPDELVRRMAGAIRDKWSGATGRAWSRRPQHRLARYPSNPDMP